MTYRIEFTKGGETVAIWQGYESHGAAMRAIHDCDSLIPFTWNYEIKAESN